MPLPLPRIEMTIDAFHTMPHRIGWKHEYWDGMARLSPQESAVAHLRLHLRNEPNTDDVPNIDPAFKLRSVLRTDENALIRLHCQTFDDSVEYAGHDDASYLASTTDSIQSFYGVKQGRGWTAGDLHGSCVVEADGELVAALLVRRDRRDGWVIAPVMVDAAYHRQGLARAMLDHVCNWLRTFDRTELNSRCHLSNVKSLAWHAACGFVEQPTSFASSHRAMHHRWMHEHHKAAGRATEASYHQELAEAYWQLRDVCQELEYRLRLKDDAS